MCLAVPGKIVRVSGSADEPSGRLATVDFNGSQMEISLAATPQAAQGDWVLVHAGYAIATVDEEQARETWAYLEQLEQFPDTQNLRVE